MVYNLYNLKKNLVSEDQISVFLQEKNPLYAIFTLFP